MINVSFNKIEDFKTYLDKNSEKDFALDVSSMNIFDCLKFTVLSSEYFYRKHPQCKLKCKLPSNDAKNLIANFNVKNLEFV